jgi:hypothetical protein
MRRRQAFTLVELLVAMALIIFIMAILTEAFSAGLTTFRQLKAIGDMQERMRSVVILLRGDLQADHFADSNRNNAAKLSQIDLRPTNSVGVVNSYAGPPSAGYFRIWQQWHGLQAGQTLPDPRTWNSTLEGNSAGEGLAGGQGVLPSTRATHQWLAFTCKVPAYTQDQTPRPEDIHSAQVPAGLGLDNQGPTPYQVPGVMNSQWYEVAYFLNATGQSAGQTPLFALYRRERPIFPGNTPPGPLPGVNWANFPNVSIAPNPQPAGSTAVNNPGGSTTSVTDPRRRFGMDGSTAGLPFNFPNGWILSGNYFGDDLLLSDVISFDIKVMLQGAPPPPTGFGDNPAFVDLPPASVNTATGALGSSSQNATFASLNPPAVVFDTWSAYDVYSTSNPKTGGWNTPGTAYSLPLPVRILAIQVTLRVWDNRTQQARQTAIIQDL